MAKVILTVLMNNGTYECRQFDLDDNGRAEAAEHMDMVQEQLQAEGVTDTKGDNIFRKIYKDGRLVCEMFTIVE